MDSGARDIADVTASARKGVRRDSVVSLSIDRLAPVKGGTTGLGGTASNVFES
jgi:hypothetical protein